MSPQRLHPSQGFDRLPRAAAGAILLILFGSTLTGCGRPYKQQEHISLAAPLPANNLIVHNSFGDVRVNADAEATEIIAEITMTARGASARDAEEGLRQIEVSLAPQEDRPDVLEAWADHPQATAQRAYSVDWQLTAPPGLPVEVHTDFGDVEARGFSGGVVLDSAFGNIKAEAAGNIHINTNFGDVDLHVLPGPAEDISAHTAFGDMDVCLPADRVGRLSAHTAFGSLDMHLEGATLRLLRQRGQHFEAQLGGSDEPTTRLDTNFGDITLLLHKPETE